ncbi:reactive mitochondrial oxygen species modulator 1-domain-containing protein [Blastocladiella britannica]|nr:reactive mitochondrial oxygen species modulator 1-domain-containing protein [Blastocladiella britannica]
METFESPLSRVYCTTNPSQHAHRIPILFEKRKKKMSHEHQGPTIADKLKMGALMGTGVGLGLGFILGNISYLMYGARGKGYLGTLSNAMTTSGVSFGLFMMIGSVVRSDADASRPLLASRAPVRVLRASPTAPPDAQSAFARFAASDVHGERI